METVKTVIKRNGTETEMLLKKRGFLCFFFRFHSKNRTENTGRKKTETETGILTTGQVKIA